MIKVYVIEEEQIDGRFFGEFSLSELPQVPNLFKIFSTLVWDNEDDVGPCDFKSCQFVSNEDLGVYLEITVKENKEERKRIMQEAKARALQEFPPKEDS